MAKYKPFKNGDRVYCIDARIGKVSGVVLTSKLDGEYVLINLDKVVNGYERVWVQSNILDYEPQDARQE